MMTLDQRRAAFALARVSAIPEGDGRTRFRAYARSFPANVLRSGLGQALAMELASANGGNADIKEGHETLLSAVSAWLVAPQGWGSNSPYFRDRSDAKGDFKNAQLLEDIVSKDEADMLRAHAETMAFAKWLKTFAEALIAPTAESAEPEQETTESSQ